jgi:hypothetical protein
MVNFKKILQTLRSGYISKEPHIMIPMCLLILVVAFKQYAFFSCSESKDRILNTTRIGSIFSSFVICDYQINFLIFGEDVLIICGF